MIRNFDNAVARLEDVCLRYEITLEPFVYPTRSIISPSRYHALVLARHALCYELRLRTPLSYPEIGRLLERDHTTVMAAISKHCARHQLPHPDATKGLTPRLRVEHEPLSA